jgi:hypothetical protein
MICPAIPKKIRLEMDSLGVSRHGGLLESLSQRGVSMARASNVLRAGTILESQRSLGNHLTSIGTDDVAAEKSVRLRIGQHLDETIRIEVGLGTRVRAERKRADFVRDVAFLQVLFTRADPSDLGVRVHH